MCRDRAISSSKNFCSPVGSTGTAAWDFLDFPLLSRKSQSAPDAFRLSMVYRVLALFNFFRGWVSSMVRSAH
eukprot:2103015-Pyramimonas_sp.AAC.1